MKMPILAFDMKVPSATQTAQTDAEINSWTLTASRSRINILDPDPISFKLKDVALGLSRASRWNGQSARWMSVAQHSVIVAGLVPKELQMAALFHDASEAFLADIPRPIKHLLPDYKKIEERFMSAIAQKFGFKYPFSSEIHEADLKAATIEARDLFNDNRDLFLFDRGVSFEEFPKIKALERNDAYELFMSAHFEIEGCF